jgi:uncharacterized damage-inducible protein DinB
MTPPVTTVSDTDQLTLSPERRDLLQSLRRHRFFLLQTIRDLDDEQARRRTTASELCLGGLVKHVAHTERQWVRFIVEGPAAMAFDPAAAEDWQAQFRLAEDESLADVRALYQGVADQTDALVVAAPDLDDDQPLPPAPWFEPGARWSMRRVLLHVIAETAQHAGHADIIRESLDGARTMG